MTTAVADPDVQIASETKAERTCDCRKDMQLRKGSYRTKLVECPNRAAWIYRHRCCSGSTFVCDDCRMFHVTFHWLMFRCRWCGTRGDVPTLVASVARLT